MQHKGRLQWRKPCWDDCPVVVQPGKEEGALPSVWGYMSPDTPTMDVVLPVLQDTASVSFEEGVSEVPFPRNLFEGNFAALDLWAPLFDCFCNSL